MRAIYSSALLFRVLDRAIFAERRVPAECTTDFSTLLDTIPSNTTVAMLCPLSCNFCVKTADMYDDLAVVYSTSMCSM